LWSRDACLIARIFARMPRLLARFQRLAGSQEMQREIQLALADMPQPVHSLLAVQEAL